MQNYCKTIGALAAASALVAGTAKAELEYSINGGYHNEYLFRGVQFGHDMTTFGVDAETSAYGLDFSAGIWYASYDTDAAVWGLGPSFFKWQTSELDIYGQVSKDLGIWGLTGSVGYIMYVNDDTGPALFGAQLDDAQEVYFGLSKEICYGISADLTYYWDIETDNDGYAELGLSKSYELTNCLSLGLGLAVGYAVEEGDLANTALTATLDWAFAENATLSPYVAYVIDGESGLYETTNEQEFIGGVNLTVSF
jgi:hypothetical protein